MPVTGVLYIFATLANLIATLSAVCVCVCVFKLLTVVYVKLYCGLLATAVYSVSTLLGFLHILLYIVHGIYVSS